jgi:hypothetical protein
MTWRTRFSPPGIRSHALRPWLVGALIVLSVVQIGELVLLQLKYQVFTGGFLQAYAYLTWPERGIFLLLGGLLDLAIVGPLYIGAILLLNRLRSDLCSYSVTSAIVVLACTALFMRYELLSHFGDAMDFLMMRNLAGGKVLDAVKYVAEDVKMLWLMLATSGLIFAAGFWFLHSRKPGSQPAGGDDRCLQPGRRILSIFAVLWLASVSAIFFVAQDPMWRFGLSKKLAFLPMASLARTLTDFDRDGYGLDGFPADPAPFDSSVYPGAIDLPDNGIDEDGLFGDLSTVSDQPAGGYVLVPSEAGRRHAILVVVESLRADVLDAVADGVEITPTMNALAANGSTATDFFSHTGFTESSVKAMFTGDLVRPSEAMSVLRSLSLNGFEISVLSGQDESFGDIARDTGMRRFAGHYFDAASSPADRMFASTLPAGLVLSGARLVTEAGSQWRLLDWSRRQFIYVNLQDAHFPYYGSGVRKTLETRPIPRDRISARSVEWLKRTYLNAVASADSSLAELLNLCDELGVLDDTAIIVVGDHGESLFDDGFLGHGFSVGDLQMATPLIVNVPGIRFSKPSGQVIVPTLIRRILGLEDASPDHDPDDPRLDANVLQVIGVMDRPQRIALMSGQGHQAIYDFRTGSAARDLAGPWFRVGDPSLESPLLEDVERLVNWWQSLRIRSPSHPGPDCDSLILSHQMESAVPLSSGSGSDSCGSSPSPH